MALELDTQRRLTVAFINTQPVDLVLRPRAKVKKAAGGFGWEESPARDPQRMRLIEPGTIPRPIVTVDGVQREVEFELLGTHDAVIGQHDVFDHDAARWEVVALAHFNGWERRALVAKIG